MYTAYGIVTVISMSGRGGCTVHRFRENSQPVYCMATTATHRDNSDDTICCIHTI